MNYLPSPEYTGDIVLSADLVDLTEQLAHNTHEVWAQRKIFEGWVYGEVLDPMKKTHPSLIPYEQLTESEKEFDRSTSGQAVRLLLKLGYKIIKGVA